MPRKDIIVMREDSSVALIRGVADAVNPIEPVTPSGAIRLAVVSQTWVNPPCVYNSVRSIQEQISELARKLHAIEAKARVGDDKGLARQADINAEATLRTNLTVQDLNARRKADFLREEQERISHDIDLQEQANFNATANLEIAANLSHEAEERRKVNETLNAEIQQRTEHDTQQDTELLHQKQELSQKQQIRNEQDEGLQRQADSNAETNIQTALTLQEVNAWRKADLTREEQARIAGDIALKELIDKTAEASLENTLGINQEAQQRRKSDKRIEALRDETGRRIEIDAHHQLQIDEAINAILQTSPAEANIRTALNLNDAIARRSALINQETQWRFAEDAGTQRQVNANAEGILQNALNLSEAFGRYREALTQEAHTRVYEDANIQAQADSNAIATLEFMANLSAEAEKRRVLRQTLVSIKSLVDWSEAEILRQIASLAEADMQNELNHALLNAERRHEEAQEREIRDEQDAGLQAQMNQLAVANMWLAVCGHETREKINKVS